MKDKARLALGIILLCLSTLTLSAPFGTATSGWSHTYGGSGDDEATLVVQTSDGGYALAGFTNSSGAGSYDFWLIKTDVNGTIQWSHTYGGVGDDEATSVVQTSDGGYAITGYTDSFGAGETDCWLVKTDVNGTMQWNQTYGGRAQDEASAVIQTSDGEYALAGATDSYGAGEQDFWLIKTDANGTMQWNQTYGGTGDDEVSALIPTIDGGYALTGYTTSYGSGMDDFWLVKADSFGKMQWSQTYGGVEDDGATCVVQASDGGYAIVGYTNSSGAGSYDFWLVKTNTNGTMLWSHAYGDTGDEFAYSVVQISDGGYALAGPTDSYGTGDVSFWLVKTDANGNMQWNEAYGGSGDNEAYSMIQTSDGGYALAGFTDSYGAGSYDVWLVKTDSSGNSVMPQSSLIPIPLSTIGIMVIIAAIVILVAVVGYRRVRSSRSTNAPPIDKMP